MTMQRANQAVALLSAGNIIWASMAVIQGGGPGFYIAIGLSLAALLMFWASEMSERKYGH